MEAVWYHARAELRRRWRATLLLVLLVGLAGGAVLTAAAGARRSSTAYDRFREETLAADMDIAFDGPPSGIDPTAEQALRELPQVEAVGQAVYPFIVPAGSGFYPYLDFLAVASRDDANGVTVDRPRLLEGRLPALDDAGEVAILDLFASEADLEVGDQVEFESFAPDQLEPLFTTGDAGPPAGPRVMLRVTGIVDAPTFLSESVGSFVPRAFLPRGFFREYEDDMAVYPGGFTVRLKDGENDVPAVSAAVREIFADVEALELSPTSEIDDRIQSTIDVIVGALLLTAVVAGVTGLVAIGQAFARHLSRDRDAQRALAALGMTARDRRFSLVIGVVPAVIGGALLAVIVAILASPSMPVGVARKAEPDPGISIDTTVLAIGFAGVVVIVALVAVLAAIPASRNRGLADAIDTDRPPSRSLRALRWAGLAPPATIGVGMVLDPRDGTAWSVRSALAGFAFGVTGLVAVVVLATSITALVDSPARYGTPWETTVPGFGGEIVEQLRDPLAGDDDVDQLGVLSTSLALIDGEESNVYALEDVKGDLGLTLLAGREPARRGEVVLGSTTLRDSGTGIGSTIEIQGAGPALVATVVGRAAFPIVDERSAAGRGALLWPEDLQAVAPDGTLNHDLIVDWADGVDAEAAGAALSEEAGVEVSAPRLPSDVNNLREVAVLPRTLAVVLAGLALLVLLHALVATTRSRRRELAVLRTLGFERRQLTATITWQATAIALLGVAAGAVLGVVIGRLVWTAMARSIGVVEDPSMPVGLLVAIAVVAPVAAILAALIPARAAGRVHPATVLRTG